MPVLRQDCRGNTGQRMRYQVGEVSTDPTGAVMTLLSILFLGFFLGMRHATDSDHVVAVTTIVSRQRQIGTAVMTGIFWGIGHSITLLVVGGAIILFGLVIPERLGMGLEFCVALMLILLGWLNLRAFRRSVDSVSPNAHAHEHIHRHGDFIHSHPHGHDPENHGHTEREVPTARLDRRFGRSHFYRILRPIIVGVVHGLAGSAAVALLVLPVIRDPIWALLYLLIFGVGTIAGMMLITAAIAAPITYSANRFRLFNRYVGAAAGVLSLIFGLFLFYQIGFVDGLFR
jgi:ABC-type nickel/cobalt efflux system permease component RcnA